MQHGSRLQQTSSNGRRLGGEQRLEIIALLYLALILALILILYLALILIPMCQSLG
jgi:hypothetical protein